MGSLRSYSKALTTVTLFSETPFVDGALDYTFPMPAFPRMAEGLLCLLVAAKAGEP